MLFNSIVLNHHLHHCIIIMCLYDSPPCDLLLGTITSSRAVITMIHLDILSIQHKARD